MNTNFNDFLEDQLSDPEIKAEYDVLEPKFMMIQAVIDARKGTGIIQKQLAEITGIVQGDISKLENGNANPSLRMLQRLAAGMGMRLGIKFVPTTNK